MNLKSLKYLFLLVMAVFALSSCSETDDESNAEFADWQAKNDKAFADTLKYARQQIANGSKEWKVILNWSLQNQTPETGTDGNLTNLTYGDTDYIVVHVLNEGTGSETPLYTDSIKMSYRGRLLPSPSYADGYVFDQTYTGNYDKATALPTSAAVNSGWIDGFTTALLNMHVGDRWMVFMPQKLAYGSTEKTGIPLYSMLRFDLVLEGYKGTKGKWVAE